MLSVTIQDYVCNVFRWSLHVKKITILGPSDPDKFILF